MRHARACAFLIVADCAATSFPEGLVFGSVVQSPVASGRLLALDASEALKHPAAVAFVDARDIPKTGVNWFGFRNPREEQVCLNVVDG